MNELLALYSRVSTAEQAQEGYSIQEQIDRMTKYCEAMKWTVFNVYTDAGFTGANTDRPALQKLIKDVKAGKVNKVLVYKLDRLSRSQKDTLTLIEDVFLANKVDFVSMSENFDTATPFGRAMVGILAVFAQLEREQIRERMNMGKYARAKLGLFGGSCRVPIGYDYIDGRLVTNEFEKLQVIRIFEMYAQGIAPRKIADTLNSEGLQHKYGKWIDKAIRDVLTRKNYLGYTPYNGEWFKGDHEAFISEDLYNTVQAIHQTKALDYKAHNHREGRVNSYLGGCIVCGRCGAKYSKHIDEDKGGLRKYEYYKCNSRIKGNPRLIKDPDCKNKSWRMEALDALVFGEIRKLALDPEYMSEVAASKPNDNRETLIHAEIDKLDKQLARLMDLYAVGGIPLDLLQQRIHKIDDQKRDLQTGLEQLAQEQAAKTTQAQAAKLIKSFGDILDRGQFDEIRNVIKSLIDRIEIEGENVTIYWRFA